MDLPLETLVLIAVVTIAAVVGLLELKYLRGRRQTKVDAAIERDDAYNAVSTTRAVADSLRQNGRDTTEADILIYKAETAYDKREFLSATELAGKAKKLLLTCKEKDLISMPSPAPAKVEESTEVPSSLVKKMPANCLESRFIIDSVQEMTSGADEKAKAEADSCLTRAQACYEAEDYNGALSEAMKARRLLTPCPPAGEKSYPSAVVRLPPPEKPANVACSPANRLCPACRVEASPDDAFCRKCGTRLES
jgi:hypothetical protein